MGEMKVESNAGCGRVQARCGVMGMGKGGERGRLNNGVHKEAISERMVLQSKYKYIIRGNNKM